MTKIMGNVDSVPIISQAKSLVQVIGNDAEGARRTQENFSRQCPVVSQTRSLVEVTMGDADAALETQKQFGHGVNDFFDGTPGAGHLKGAIHYACNDHEGGDRAMKSASRTTGSMIGGVAGFAVGGPVGAFAGGVAGGALMDGITTGVDSAVHKEYRPSGLVASVNQIVEKPNDPGQWFDTFTTPVFDGITGMTAGSGPKASVPIKSGKSLVVTDAVKRPSNRPSMASTVDTLSGHSEGRLSRAKQIEGPDYLKCGKKTKPSGRGGGGIGGGGNSRSGDKGDGGARGGGNRSGGDKGGGGGGNRSGGSSGDKGGAGGGNRSGGSGGDKGGGDDQGGSGKSGTKGSPCKISKREAWYKIATDLLQKLSTKDKKITNGKQFMMFLKKIGYEKERMGKGDHVIFEFKNNEKFRSFLEEEGVNLDEIDVNNLPIIKSVSVDSGGTNPNTIKGTLTKVFGLDSCGQKKGY